MTCDGGGAPSSAVICYGGGASGAATRATEGATTARAAEHRRQLVTELKHAGHLRSGHVEAAFLAVPRHVFVPQVSLQEAYRDQSIQIKYVDGRSVSSSSQPAIMAVMLEQLDLRPGHRVLEIGTGSGYNAALMAHIVGERGRVVSVDIDADLVENATRRLAEAGFGGVEAVCADGGYGYATAAPYDRIILTVGTADITPAWFEQLEARGRLLVPLSLRGNLQKSIAFEREGDHLASRSIADCGFMLLRGAFGSTKTVVSLTAPGLHVAVDEPDQLDADEFYRLLTGPATPRRAGGVRVSPSEVWGGLSLWLALREPAFIGLGGLGEACEKGPVPWVSGYGGPCATGLSFGAFEPGAAGAVALLAAPEGHSLFADSTLQAAAFDLFVRSYGEADHVAERLVEHIRAWDRAGRPSADRAQIRAYYGAPSPLPGEVYTIVKRSCRLAATWPGTPG